MAAHLPSPITKSVGESDEKPEAPEWMSSTWPSHQIKTMKPRGFTGKIINIHHNHTSSVTRSWRATLSFLSLCIFLSISNQRRKMINYTSLAATALQMPRVGLGTLGVAPLEAKPVIVSESFVQILIYNWNCAYNILTSIILSQLIYCETERSTIYGISPFWLCTCIFQWERNWRCLSWGNE